MNPLHLLEQVAEWLEELGVSVVFTGGTTIPLYLDAIAASEYRPTRDVDCIVDTKTYGAYAQLVARLRASGFSDALEDGAPICRFEREGILVDVMPIESAVLGFTNRWYPPAWRAPTKRRLPSGRAVPVFRLEYLLASKISAFESRGAGDPYLSHDFEDIVTLLDGCPDALPAIANAEIEVRIFLKAWLQRLVARSDAYDLLAAHVSRSSGGGDRAEALLHRLQQFSSW